MLGVASELSKVVPNFTWHFIGGKKKNTQRYFLSLILEMQQSIL